MILFHLSSKLFQGYELRLDVDQILDLDQVCRDIKTNLRVDLERLHLQNLVEELDKLHFHTHDYTLIDIFCGPPGHVWYICDHCSESS